MVTHYLHITHNVDTRDPIGSKKGTNIYFDRHMSQQLVPGHEQLIWDELESCEGYNIDSQSQSSGGHACAISDY